MEISTNCLFKKIFKDYNMDVLSVTCYRNQCWYRLDDITKILEVTKKNIKKNASQYITKYKKLVDNHNKININEKTLFINNSGLFVLIPFSQNIKAKKAWKDITNTILPSIYINGIYILPQDTIELDKFIKPIFSNETIKSYLKKSAIFLAYVGEYDNNHLLKFGRTRDLSMFKLAVYKKRYQFFNILKIWPVINEDLTEYNIVKILNADNPISRNQMGIFHLPDMDNIEKILIINRIHNLEYYVKIISDIIIKTKLFGNDISPLYGLDNYHYFKIDNINN